MIGLNNINFNDYLNNDMASEKNNKKNINFRDDFSYEDTTFNEIEKSLSKESFSDNVSSIGKINEFHELNHFKSNENKLSTKNFNTEFNSKIDSTSRLNSEFNNNINSEKKKNMNSRSNINSLNRCNE